MSKNNEFVKILVFGNPKAPTSVVLTDKDEKSNGYLISENAPGTLDAEESASFVIRVDILKRGLEHIFK